MINVAYDYQIFACQEYGGVSRTVCEQARALSALEDIRVSVVAPRFCNSYLRQLQEQGALDVLGAYENFAPGCVPRLLDVCREKSPGRLEELHPDIVHESYATLPPPEKGSAPVVVVIHDMIHELFPDACHPADTTSQAKKLALARADHVVCVSENTRRDLLRCFDLPEAMVSVAHHGVSTLPRPEPPNDSEGGELLRRTPFLLFVGHRGGYKNFKTLLRAYAHSPALRELPLACFGGGGFSPAEREALDTAGVSGTVLHLSGRDAQLSWLYQNAALFVYPSRYEGFGLPPLEAMSAGCPVACGNGGSLPEVVGDAALLFEPDSAEDMARAMERALGSIALSAELRRRGRERAGMFTWDKNAGIMRGIYLKLMEHTGGPDA